MSTLIPQGGDAQGTHFQIPINNQSTQQKQGQHVLPINTVPLPPSPPNPGPIASYLANSATTNDQGPRQDMTTALDDAMKTVKGLTNPNTTITNKDKNIPDNNTVHSETINKQLPDDNQSSSVLDVLKALISSIYCTYEVFTKGAT